MAGETKVLPAIAVDMKKIIAIKNNCPPVLITPSDGTLQKALSVSISSGLSFNNKLIRQPQV
jgi:hypothetical protein